VQSGPHSPPCRAVTATDDMARSDAGLAPVATSSALPGSRAFADEVIDVGDRPRHTRPGRKVPRLIHAVVAGADRIENDDMVRSRSSGAVLGHRG
jgi:hypothetical protein